VFQSGDDIGFSVDSLVVGAFPVETQTVRTEPAIRKAGVWGIHCPSNLLITISSPQGTKAIAEKA
jgi:hypothetical protein